MLSRVDTFLGKTGACNIEGLCHQATQLTSQVLALREQVHSKALLEDSLQETLARQQRVLATLHDLNSKYLCQDTVQAVELLQQRTVDLEAVQNFLQDNNVLLKNVLQRPLEGAAPPKAAGKGLQSLTEAITFDE